MIETPNVVRTWGGDMKSNADIWDCKDATLEIVDGKGMITNTDDRTGNINSEVITLDSSKHVFGNAGRGGIRKMESKSSRS